jgi:hypothetical protein
VSDEVSIGNVVDMRAAMGSIQDRIVAADIVLVDVSGSRQDVIYELGFAHGSNKPTILVSDDAAQPTLYDLAAFYVHLYKKSGQDAAFHERLVAEIGEALREPDHFSERVRLHTGMMGPLMQARNGRSRLKRPSTGRG